MDASQGVVAQDEVEARVRRHEPAASAEAAGVVDGFLDSGELRVSGFRSGSILDRRREPGACAAIAYVAMEIGVQS